MINETNHSTTGLSLAVNRNIRGYRGIRGFRGLRKWALAAICSAASLFIGAPAAQAQLSNIDDDGFIVGLQRLGMQDLLRAYVEKNPPKDETRKALLQIAINKGIWSGGDFDDEARGTAADEVLALYSALIKRVEIELPVDIPERAFWQTDAAEFVLFDSLAGRHTYANLFYELGRPTDEMAQAFEQLIPVAMQYMVGANMDVAELVRELPKQRDFEQKWINTGRSRILERDMKDRKVPFYHALASHYASLIPAAKKEKVVAERDAEALKEAEANLTVAARNNPKGMLAGLIQSIYGRMQLHKGNGDTAIKHLDSALSLYAAAASEEQVNVMYPLEATIAKAFAQHKLKQSAQAIATLDGFREKVQNAPLLMILLADAEYRITGNDSVYDSPKLLQHPSLTDYKDGLAEFLRNRDVPDDIKDEDLAKAEPKKLFAVADKLRRKGAEQGQDAAAAGKSLERAIQLYDLALAHKDATPAIAADSLYGKAHSLFLLKKPFDAAVVFAELGEKHPDNKLGPSGATNSMRLLHSMWNSKEPERSKVRADAKMIRQMDATTALIVEKYPNTDMAREYAYERASFLMLVERFKDAVDAYEKIPATHPFFADSQHEAFYCQHMLWRKSDPETKKVVAKKLVTDAPKLLRLLEQAGAAADKPERKDDLERKLGDAILRLCEVKAETLGLHAEVKADLNPAKFDVRFARFEGLLIDAQAQRIGINALLGDFDTVLKDIQSFVQKRPNDAGAMIQNVLGQINRRIDELTATREAEKAQALAESAIKLAQLLNDWAKLHYKGGGAEAFRLSLARQYFLARKFDQATAVYKDMLDDKSIEGANLNLDINEGLADAMSAAGDFSEAGKIFNRFIAFIHDKYPRDKPAFYYRLYAKRLIIADKEYDQLMASASADDKALAVKVAQTITLRIREFVLEDPRLEMIPEAERPAIRDLRTKFQNVETAKPKKPPAAPGN